MNLSLDHRQRLNLIAVLGAYDVKGRELHAVWHLQDLLDLDDTERQAVNFRESSVNGQKLQTWDDTKTLAERCFDLSEADVNRVRQAIEDFPHFRSSRDRVWLEPLLAQLPGAGTATNAAQSNGKVLNEGVLTTR
jgi:hypothetical protein